ncbi:MAG: DUF2283 domain-containing protein [Chloroflexi bacterium]|nr:DUF2283 domain-containing protein [Chloroflexota bacterium]
MKNQLGILYDKEADVLYVSLGRPKYTSYVEVDDDFILRLDPTSGAIVGFTIIDFSAHFTVDQPILSLPLLADFVRVPDQRRTKALAERKASYQTKKSGVKTEGAHRGRARKSA